MSVDNFLSLKPSETNSDLQKNQVKFLNQKAKSRPGGCRSSKITEMTTDFDKYPIDATLGGKRKYHRSTIPF